MVTRASPKFKIPRGGKSEHVVSCQVVINPLRFVGYLLRFHLASDWSRKNKYSRNFLWRSRFYGKDCNRLTSSIIRDFITMSSSQLDRPVVSTDWLNEELKNSKGGLVVLDTTWFSDKDACSGFSE